MKTLNVFENYQNWEKACQNTLSSIDSIVQHHGKTVPYLFTEVAILANKLDSDSHLCYVSSLSSAFASC